MPADLDEVVKAAVARRLSEQRPGVCGVETLYSRSRHCRGLHPQICRRRGRALTRRDEQNYVGPMARPIYDDEPHQQVTATRMMRSERRCWARGKIEGAGNYAPTVLATSPPMTGFRQELLVR